MKYKKSLIVILLLVGVFRYGYYGRDDSSEYKNYTMLDKNNTTISPSNLEEYIGDSVEELLKKTITNDFWDSDLFICEISNHDIYSFIIFLVKKEGVLYEGVACIEMKNKLYELKDIDIAIVDLNVPFTKHTVVLSLNNGRSCKIIGGYINDKNINEIHFRYKDDPVDVIKIGPNQSTYINQVMGDINNVDEIVGFHKNSKAIYSY